MRYSCSFSSSDYLFYVILSFDFVCLLDSQLLFLIMTETFFLKLSVQIFKWAWVGRTVWSLSTLEQVYWLFFSHQRDDRAESALVVVSRHKFAIYCRVLQVKKKQRGFSSMLWGAPGPFWSLIFRHKDMSIISNQLTFQPLNSPCNLHPQTLYPKTRRNKTTFHIDASQREPALIFSLRRFTRLTGQRFHLHAGQTLHAWNEPLRSFLSSDGVLLCHMT